MLPTRTTTTQQVTPEQKKAAAGHKDLGNKLFVTGKFDEAAKHFTDAIAEDPTDHIFYSNRSACYASVGKLSAAVEDAEKCIELKPDWGKGKGGLHCIVTACARFTTHTHACAQMQLTLASSLRLLPRRRVGFTLRRASRPVDAEHK